MSLIQKIYDSVHRFIHIDPIESALIYSAPFQRLLYINQLGVTFFVYPGATHRRFEHSLGVMELSSAIYDQITKETSLVSFPGATQKLLALSLPGPSSPEHTYWRKILRLASLCHDLGHLPFSHVAEKALLGEAGHEGWTYKMIDSNYLEPIWEQLAKELPSSRDVKTDILKIALGEKKFLAVHPNASPFTPWEKLVSEILTGDFFGSDRIDYLLRDAKNTGLAYGLFDYHQLLEMLKILPDQKGGFALGIEENGVESCEALLLARHYMHKRLYQYSTVKAYGFHLSRFMAKIYPELGKRDLSYYLSMTDNEVLAELRKAAYDPSHPGYSDAFSLTLRKNRYRAIPLPSSLSPETLATLKEELKEEEVSFELAKKPAKKFGLSFPVLRTDGLLTTGEELSEISIPKEERSWVYTPSHLEAKVRQTIRELPLPLR